MMSKSDLGQLVLAVIIQLAGCVGFVITTAHYEHETCGKSRTPSYIVALALLALAIFIGTSYFNL